MWRVCRGEQGGGEEGKEEEMGEDWGRGGKGQKVGDWASSPVQGPPSRPGPLSHHTHTCPACPVRICSRRGPGVSLPILVSAHSTGGRRWQLPVAPVPPLGSPCPM